jgi:hypothetical protein
MWHTCRDWRIWKRVKRKSINQMEHKAAVAASSKWYRTNWELMVARDLFYTFQSAQMAK